MSRLASACSYSPTALLHWYQAIRLHTVSQTRRYQLSSSGSSRHQDADGAWGGIQPPWVYSLMALSVENFDLEHPTLAKGFAALDSHWSYERDGTLHIQASESSVWDTLLGDGPRDAGLRRAGFT